MLLCAHGLGLDLECAHGLGLDLECAHGQDLQLGKSYKVPMGKTYNFARPTKCPWDPRPTKSPWASTPWVWYLSCLS